MTYKLNQTYSYLIVLFLRDKSVFLGKKLTSQNLEKTEKESDKKQKPNILTKETSDTISMAPKGHRKCNTYYKEVIVSIFAIYCLINAKNAILPMSIILCHGSQRY